MNLKQQNGYVNQPAFQHQVAAQPLKVHPSYLPLNHPQNGKWFLSTAGYHMIGNFVQPSAPKMGVSPVTSVNLKAHTQSSQSFVQHLGQSPAAGGVITNVPASQNVLTVSRQTSSSQSIKSSLPSTNPLTEHNPSTIQRPTQIITGPAHLMNELANKHPPKTLWQSKRQKETEQKRCSMAYFAPVRPIPKTAPRITTNSQPQPTLLSPPSPHVKVDSEQKPIRKFQPTQTVYFGEGGKIISNPRIPKNAQQLSEGKQMTRNPSTNPIGQPRDMPHSGAPTIHTTNSHSGLYQKGCPQNTPATQNPMTPIFHQSSHGLCTPANNMIPQNNGNAIYSSQLPKNGHAETNLRRSSTALQPHALIMPQQHHPSHQTALVENANPRNNGNEVVYRQDVGNNQQFLHLETRQSGQTTPGGSAQPHSQSLLPVAIAAPPNAGNPSNKCLVPIQLPRDPNNQLVYISNGIPSNVQEGNQGIVTTQSTMANPNSNGRQADIMVNQAVYRHALVQNQVVKLLATPQSHHPNGQILSNGNAQSHSQSLMPIALPTQSNAGTSGRPSGKPTTNTHSPSHENCKNAATSEAKPSSNQVNRTNNIVTTRSAEQMPSEQQAKSINVPKNESNHEKKQEELSTTEQKDSTSHPRPIAKSTLINSRTKSKGCQTDIHEHKDQESRPTSSQRKVLNPSSSGVQQQQNTAVQNGVCGKKEWENQPSTSENSIPMLPQVQQQRVSGRHRNSGNQQFDVINSLQAQQEELMSTVSDLSIEVKRINDRFNMMLLNQQRSEDVAKEQVRYWQYVNATAIRDETLLAPESTSTVRANEITRPPEISNGQATSTTTANMASSVMMKTPKPHAPWFSGPSTSTYASKLGVASDLKLGAGENHLDEEFPPLPASRKTSFIPISAKWRASIPKSSDDSPSINSESANGPESSSKPSIYQKVLGNKRNTLKTYFVPSTRSSEHVPVSLRTESTAPKRKANTRSTRN